MILFSQDPVTFVKESDEDNVAQIFIDTLEQNIKNIFEQFNFIKRWY